MDNVDNVETVATEEETGQENKHLDHDVKDGQKQAVKDDQEKKYTDSDVDRILGRKYAQWQRKLDKILNPQETELDKRERNVTVRENRANVKEKLINDGLPTGLADLFNLEDTDGLEDQYSKLTEIFRNEFDNAVQTAVKSALRGNSFKRGTNSTNQGIEDSLKSAFAPKK